MGLAVRGLLTQDGEAVSTATGSQPGQEMLFEVVCPHCRATGHTDRQDRLVRCANDGYVMVRPQALAAADGDPFLGLTVSKRFVILELLGAGSMATVYRARHEAMARDIALKVLRSDRLVDVHAAGRFQREAQAMSLLTSPHTATVFDFGEIRVDADPTGTINGSLFLAMELLEGESLGTRLKREGRINVADAVRFARYALHSLAEAHEKGVIHRDLKPDNLVIVASPTGEGELCKVLDFGIAKVLRASDGVDALETQAGTVFGTPRYMSPEQAQGKPLDQRSDLYSLGVILYHMLAGQAPYTDRDAVVVMAHHIKTPPKPLAVVSPDLKLPPGLEALVMRSLSKEPSQRPQTAMVFLRALEGFSELVPGSADRSIGTGDLAAVLSRVSARVPRGAMLAVVGALSLLAVVLGTMWATPGSRARSLVAVSAGLTPTILDVGLHQPTAAPVAPSAAPTADPSVSAPLTGSAPPGAPSASALGPGSAAPPVSSKAAPLPSKTRGKAGSSGRPSPAGTRRPGAKGYEHFDQL